jgi:hypothetical protein
MISCHVFMHDFGTQSHLHGHRRDIINNKALYQCAVNAELPQFILSKRFSIKTWYPASILVRTSFNPVPDDEMLPTPEDKSAADPGDVGYAVHKDAKTHQLADKVRPHTTLAEIISSNTRLTPRPWPTSSRLSSVLRTSLWVSQAYLSSRSRSRSPCWNTMLRRRWARRCSPNLQRRHLPY